MVCSHADGEGQAELADFNSTPNGNKLLHSKAAQQDRVMTDTTLNSLNE